MDKKTNTPFRSGYTPMLVSLEGNIGAGKTEILSYYRFDAGARLLWEPISEWVAFKEYNLLDLKYKDKHGHKNHEFNFQILANCTRQEQMLSTAHSRMVRLMERSNHSGFHVFAKTARNQGKLTNLQMELLKKMLESSTCGPAEVATTPDLIIYLQVTPETCYDRVKKRGRKEEKDLRLGDLRELHEAHEKWLNVDKKHQGSWAVPCPVVRISNNGDKNDIAEVITQINTIVLEMREKKRIMREKYGEYENEELDPEDEWEDHSKKPQVKINLDAGTQHDQHQQKPQVNEETEKGEDICVRHIDVEIEITGQDVVDGRIVHILGDC